MEKLHFSGLRINTNLHVDEIQITVQQNQHHRNEADITEEEENHYHYRESSSEMNSDGITSHAAVEKNLQPFLYIPSGQFGTPTAAQSSNSSSSFTHCDVKGEPKHVPLSRASTVRGVMGPRKMSFTDECNPYLYSPSQMLKQRIKAESHSIY